MTPTVFPCEFYEPGTNPRGLPDDSDTLGEIKYVCRLRSVRAILYSHSGPAIGDVDTDGTYRVRRTHAK